MKATSKRAPRVQVAVLCWLSLLIFGIATSFAQDAEQKASQTFKSNVLSRMMGKTSGTDGLGLTAYEGVIDRDSYRVGPGDKLMLQVWSPAYEESPTVVSGDGRVAVPFAGPVDVAGLTLTEAESAIAAEFLSALKRGRVSISLIEPRKIRVHVTGQVAVPGTLALPATARVADAIEMSGGIRSVPEYYEGDSVMVPLASLRQIEMRDGTTGSVTHVDLLRFYQGGDLSGNPYLTSGAVMYVPPKSEDAQVGVFGEVRNPGLYEYAVGDDVASLLSLAGGLTSLADSAKISVHTAVGETKQLNYSPSSLATPVHVGDRVYVGGNPKSKILGSVSLSGQLKYPGGYTITPGVTTVAEVIEQAGGLSPEAAAQSARLVRHGDDRVDMERRRLSANPLKGTQKDDPMMLADMEMSAEFARWAYGTVVLDLTAKEGESGWAGSVVLQDGDHLEVPSQPLGVRVLGYVNNAGEVPWVEGANLSYYLKEAGGKNAAGWKGRAVVLKARNGSQIRYSNRVSVNPGDVIFVPQRPRTTGWDRIKDVITVVAQVATIVLVIDSANK